MTRTEAYKMLKILQGAYPRHEFSDATIDVYATMLQDLPGDATGEAIRRLVATSKWLPTIAEIRREVAEIVYKLPTTEEAWEEARRAARHYSPYGNPAPFEYSCEAVKQAVRAIGIEVLAYSTNGEQLGREFRRVYDGIRERQVERIQHTKGLGLPHLQALPSGEGSA